MTLHRPLSWTPACPLFEQGQAPQTGWVRAPAPFPWCSHALSSLPGDWDCSEPGAQRRGQPSQPPNADKTPLGQGCAVRNLGVMGQPVLPRLGASPWRTLLQVSSHSAGKQQGVVAILCPSWRGREPQGWEAEAELPGASGCASPLQGPDSRPAGLCDDALGLLGRMVPTVFLGWHWIASVLAPALPWRSPRRHLLFPGFIQGGLRGGPPHPSARSQNLHSTCSLRGTCGPRVGGRELGAGNLAAFDL